MHIIEETQLDFDDVLIQPKRSSINSRQEVDIYREFKWTAKDGKTHSFTCIPISAANMGTVGTPQMAIELAKNGYMSCLEKHLTAKEIFSVYDYLTAHAIIRQEATETMFRSRVFVSIGTRESFDILDEVNATYPLIGINIDVPNGYFPKLIERVRECRDRYPNSFIVAGSVVTGDIVQDLLRNGANCIKTGIGQGCFTGDSKVLTETGFKQIKNIAIGDKVLTHLGTYEEVTNKFTFFDHSELITINGITCTPNHKFYVANITDISNITEANYKEYCFWIEAKNLDYTKHRLIELCN